MAQRQSTGLMWGALVGVLVVIAIASIPWWLPAGSSRNAMALSDASSSSAAPDIAHGQQIALNGTGCGTGGQCFSCFQCHSADGAGSPVAGFPRLAGLSFHYLYHSLEDFRAGTRQSDIMRPVAAALTDNAMRDVAAYFEQAHPDPAASPSAPKQAYDPGALRRGMSLAQWGDEAMRIPACNNCHGPRGEGLAPTYPALANQYAEYLADQLRAWRVGRRSGDPLNIMGDIAARLTDQQIDDVSQYFASIGVTPEALKLRSAITMTAPSMVTAGNPQRKAVPMQVPRTGTSQ